MIIDIKYSKVRNFAFQLAPVKENNKWFFINEKGEEKKNLLFEDAYPFLSKSVAPIRLKNKWGFVNSKMNIVIQPIYEQFKEFNSFLVSVKKNNKWFFFDGKLNLYERDSAYKNYFIVKQNQSYGALNKKENLDTY